MSKEWSEPDRGKGFVDEAERPELSDELALVDMQAQPREEVVNQLVRKVHRVRVKREEDERRSVNFFKRKAARAPCHAIILGKSILV